MSADNFLDSEYVEYIIIGAHTLTWMTALILWLAGTPLTELQHLNPVLLVVLIPFLFPFTFILGLMFDSLTNLLVFLPRKLIKRFVLEGSSASLSTDEQLASRSSDLYLAYVIRMKRTRIMSAAIFNWLLVGGALLLYIGSPDSGLGVIIGIASISLTVLSVYSWFDHTRRAYSFLRGALEAIHA